MDRIPQIFNPPAPWNFGGQISNYGPSGYYASLPVGLLSNCSAYSAALAQLKDNGWADAQTGAIFLEFNIYNGNVDRMCAVVVLFEVDSAGGIWVNYKSFVTPPSILTTASTIIAALFDVFTFLAVLCVHKTPNLSH